MRASLGAGYRWLRENACDLLPDSRFFWNMSTQIALKQSLVLGICSGDLAHRLVMPPDYCDVARFATDLIPKLPLARMRLSHPARSGASIVPNASINPVLINRILKEAVTGPL